MQNMVIYYAKALQASMDFVHGLCPCTLARRAGLMIGGSIPTQGGAPSLPSP